MSTEGLPHNEGYPYTRNSTSIGKSDTEHLAELRELWNKPHFQGAPLLTGKLWDPPMLSLTSVIVSKDWYDALKAKLRELDEREKG